jgi:hypothetical protein
MDSSYFSNAFSITEHNSPCHDFNASMSNLIFCATCHFTVSFLSRVLFFAVLAVSQAG